MNDCKYCGDSIHKFQIKAHDGCARLAGAREMVDKIEPIFLDKTTTMGRKLIKVVNIIADFKKEQSGEVL